VRLFPIWGARNKETLVYGLLKENVPTHYVDANGQSRKTRIHSDGASWFCGQHTLWLRHRRK
jgi:hypothetical protein